LATYDRYTCITTKRWGKLRACTHSTVGAVALLAAMLSGSSQAGGLQRVQSSPFGRAGDRDVQLYTLANIHGIQVQVMTYGATIIALKTPDRSGQVQNIVLGFDSLEPYLAGVPYLGATVGRYANRIANARFTLNGRSYQLDKNDGPNTLHGGFQGFDKRVWKAEAGEDHRVARLRLNYVSAAGEGGFPGELTAHVTYELSDDDALMIEYQAVSTEATPVNLTNHAYFNLAADPQQTILDHRLMINADRFTPVDATLIPLGNLQAVAGTPFDFRKPKVIGSRIENDALQLRLGHGYDHNFALKKPRAGALTLAAVLSDPASGRSVEVRTTQPGLQFYTGNFLGGSSGGLEASFKRRSAVCLETQHFPDSPNQPSFPSAILQRGQTYSEITTWKFRVHK